MVIISKAMINAFARKNPVAIKALNNWYVITKGADWSSFSDIKATFRTVDAVGNDRFIFNIKGNDFRLIAMIFFDKRTVYVRFIGTHAEYDKIKDCSII
jgi:mRNA interferase HigB